MKNCPETARYLRTIKWSRRSHVDPIHPWFVSCFSALELGVLLCTLFLSVHKMGPWRHMKWVSCNWFFTAASEHLASKTDTAKVIMSGDWNTTLNPIDKSGGQPWKATNYRNALVSLMEEINSIDVYRQLHTTTKSFSYESKPLKVRSRIDFFLISRPLSNHVRKTETRNSIAPDHKSIYLNLEIKNEFKRGPGLWKFNNTLLEDKHFKEFVTIKYPQILEKYSEVTERNCYGN